MFVPVEVETVTTYPSAPAPPDTPGRVEVLSVRGIARIPGHRYPWPRTLATLDSAQRATIDAEATALDVDPQELLSALYAEQSHRDRAIADADERLDLLHLAIRELARLGADDEPRRAELWKTIQRLRRG